MKLRVQNPDQHPDQRSELTAAATVVAVLAVGTLAKLGVAAQFFHLAH